MIFYTIISETACHLVLKIYFKYNFTHAQFCKPIRFNTDVYGKRNYSRGHILRIILPNKVRKAI
jgi:hypothetical protein